MTSAATTAASRSGPAVSIVGLTVVRGGSAVLEDLDLGILAGVVTGLIGPSGCGKTTLMRSIVGVQLVRSGSVTVLGLPAGCEALRRQVGYVTQEASVYDDLSVGENLRYFASVLGVGRAAVRAAVETVHLPAQEHQLVGQLSGGQRSRVSLAVALLGSPRLLVLDEPTVGLDPVLRRDLWHVFADLARAGTTLLVSSHVMDEAAMCDRLMLMRDGRILTDSTVPELYAKTGASDVGTAFLTLIDRGSPQGRSS